MSAWGAKTTSDEVAYALRSEIEGKNILITGASPNGLGSDVVRVLAKYANLVVLAGRNTERLEKTVALAKVEAPNANLRILLLDLLSLDSVKRAAEEVLAYQEPLHVLFNNAATPAMEYKIVEGIESQFYADHLAHFLFTNLVLPKLRASVLSNFSPRVVTISSSGHAFGPVRFDDINFTQGGYSSILGYSQSKTANLLFTLELAKRLKGDGILAFCLHPGVIWTRLVQAGKQGLEEAGVINQAGALNPDFGVWKSLAEGSATHLVAAFDPSIKGRSGSYLIDCRVQNDQLAHHAADPASAKKLWELSEKLVGANFL